MVMPELKIRPKSQVLLEIQKKYIREVVMYPVLKKKKIARTMAYCSVGHLELKSVSSLSHVSLGLPLSREGDLC